MPSNDTSSPDTTAAAIAKNNWLVSAARNDASKAGEDGIIAKIFEILGVKTGWCLEFGAWDGKHLSNTWTLLANSGWSGIMIEGDTTRYQQCKELYKANPKVHCFNHFVQFEGPHSLNAIIASTPCPKDFDLISIDVDGNDWHFWESLTDYQPKLVVIEFNPTIPDDIDWVQPRNPAVNQGASLKSLCVLGRKKGYELCCLTDKNAFFIDQRYFPLLNVPDNRLEVMRDASPYLIRLFQGYDGTLFAHGLNQVKWHKLPFGSQQLQLLPAIFRQYPGNMPFWKRPLYRAYKKWLQRNN